jgi:DNA-binding transcriptional ArsR family regulator
MSAEKLGSELKEAAPVFAALGDRTRLRLVVRLCDGEALSITQLTSESKVTRQAITKHLHVLEDAGLVRGSRHGREQLWELDARQLATARRCLKLISRQWDEALERLKAAVE